MLLAATLSWELLQKAIAILHLKARSLTRHQALTGRPLKELLSILLFLRVLNLPRRLRYLTSLIRVHQRLSPLLLLLASRQEMAIQLSRTTLPLVTLQLKNQLQVAMPKLAIPSPITCLLARVRQMFQTSRR